jgi:hypothetical protein
LYVVKIIEETLAVVAAMTIVGQFGGLVETVEGIVAEVALRAPGCPTDQAYRLQFIEQIGGVLVDVSMRLTVLPDVRCRAVMIGRCSFLCAKS